MSSGADAAGLDDDDFAAAAAERPHLVQNVAPPEAAVLVEDLGFADGALRSLPRVEVPSAARPGAALTFEYCDVPPVPEECLEADVSPVPVLAPTSSSDFAGRARGPVAVGFALDGSAGALVPLEGNCPDSAALVSVGDLDIGPDSRRALDKRQEAFDCRRPDFAERGLWHQREARTFPWKVAFHPGVEPPSYSCPWNWAGASSENETAAASASALASASASASAAAAADGGRRYQASSRL